MRGCGVSRGGSVIEMCACVYVCVFHLRRSQKQQRKLVRQAFNKCFFL